MTKDSEAFSLLVGQLQTLMDDTNDAVGDLLDQAYLHGYLDCKDEQTVQEHNAIDDGITRNGIFCVHVDVCENVSDLPYDAEFDDFKPRCSRYIKQQPKESEPDDVIDALRRQLNRAYKTRKALDKAFKENHQ